MADSDGLQTYIEAQILYDTRPKDSGWLKDIDFESFIRTLYAFRISNDGRQAVYRFIRQMAVLILGFCVAALYWFYQPAYEGRNGLPFPLYNGLPIVSVVVALGILVTIGTTALQFAEKRQLWVNKILIEQASSQRRGNAGPTGPQHESTTGPTTTAPPTPTTDTPAAEPASPLSLDHLWSANRQQIETYHKIVLGYASSSRIYTLTALSVGFIFIAVIGYLAVHASGTATAVSASIVTAVSATLTGYVARATLRNSESSSQELRAFFEHPLDLERALAAERLVNDMQDEKEQAEARLVVINYLTRDRSKSGPAAAKKLARTVRKPKSKTDASPTTDKVQQEKGQQDPAEQ